jgi:hypothetical protein
MSLEEKIQKLVEIDEDLKTLKCEIEKEVKKLRATVTWVVGVGITLLVIIVGAASELRVRMSTAEEKITTINQNYTPFEIVVGLTESNEKLIDVLKAGGDDVKFAEALKEQKDFHQEAIKLMREQSMRTRGGIKQ